MTTRLLASVAILISLTTSSPARVTCKQMHLCAQACQALQDGHRSLDRDHDGIPCEKLCHKPCKTKKKGKK